MSSSRLPDRKPRELPCTALREKRIPGKLQNRWAVAAGAIITLTAVGLTGCALRGASGPATGPSQASVEAGAADENAPVKLTRSSLKQARAAVAAGRLQEAFRIFQAILTSAPPDDRRRPEAMYWTGMLRLSSDPALRDVDKGRALLKGLAAASPEWEHSYEATLALALTGEVEAVRAAAIETESKLAEAELAKQTCWQENQDLSTRILEGEDEISILRTEITTRRTETENLREEVRRKDEALQRVKEAVVGWKPSR